VEGITFVFLGELFSVSPFMAKRLANLFVLNERVALLGRWKHGFFGMVPVGEFSNFICCYLFPVLNLHLIRRNERWFHYR